MFLLKHEKDKQMCSNLWTYFQKVLSVAYSEPFTRKMTCTEKAPARKNEPILFNNIYTFTQRKTHLVCQTNRKTFFLLRGYGRDGASTEKIKLCFYCTRLRIITSPPVLWEKAFSCLSLGGKRTMTPMQRDTWGWRQSWYFTKLWRRRVYGRHLCTGRTNGVQNKNKDTLY